MYPTKKKQLKRPRAHAAEDYRQPRTSYLKHLEEELKQKKDAELWFAALWEERGHWLPFRCNFQLLTLSYGDPLKMKGTSHKIIQKTLWWLRGRFDKKFKCDGDILTCGVQTDATSCGLISGNTIAHNTVGEHLWDASRRVQERMRWFEVLSMLCIESEAVITLGPTRNSSMEGFSNIDTDIQPPTLPLSLARILNPIPTPEAEAPPTAQHMTIPAFLSRLLNPIPTLTQPLERVSQSSGWSPIASDDSDLPMRAISVNSQEVQVEMTDLYYNERSDLDESGLWPETDESGWTNELDIDIKMDISGAVDKFSKI
ncbi:hypothetical protein C8J57DRAFT_1599309 [Mycena rebaudengoi]|nr:hypothetical protein C8J57DRAFT_1599309 [Mycena rebaudengoi]